MAGRSVVLCAAVLAAFALAPAARALNPQTAGLQVALRAYGLYGGPIDGIAGLKTVRATKAFQNRAGLVPDGRASARTRIALGPLGRPLFGRRTLRLRTFGWDVSVLQFLLARRGVLVPVDGYFDGATSRALRRYQRSRRLHVDGIAGPRTMASLARGRPELAPTTDGAGAPGVGLAACCCCSVFTVLRALSMASGFCASAFRAEDPPTIIAIASMPVVSFIYAIPTSSPPAFRVLLRRLPRKVSNRD